MSTANNLNVLISYVLWGDFGLLTVVPSFLFKILFPIITSFYLLQFFLLESNLLQILSCKLDRFLNKLGLSAATMLPIILGFGCVTVALGTLQLTQSNRERRIAQILLCIIVPCSAQLVINTVLVFQTSQHYIWAYILIVTLAFALLGMILNFIFPQDAKTAGTGRQACRSNKYRFSMPKFFPLISKSFRKSIDFLLETAVPFAIGNIIVSILYFFGYIDKLCQLAAPLVCDFLHLPSEATTIFILSIIKKDLGAASLLTLFSGGAFSETQIFVCIVMLTFFVPCLASMIVLFKHEKLSVSIGIWLFCILLSLGAGKILSCLFILP